MDPRAMAPLGLALRRFLDGETEAELVLRRDDGVESRIPVRAFFRDPRESSAVDVAALEHARGRILDSGAGSGLHTLVLQERGLSVTAIDLDPTAVDVMRERGVKDARVADIFAFEAGGGEFDTLLMLGHGIGVVETLGGLDRFLDHARGLLARGGQVLLDSLEVHATKDEATLAYHEANREAGRYIGEVGVRLELEGQAGPRCGWLHVDSETLTERAKAHGWHCQVVARDGADYLARLTIAT